jgi:GNAT superfamily N-acetyltransferase
MTRPEVDLALDWAAIEGWNPGLHDADCFYAADPKGFLVGLLDDQPIAMISAVKYGESFGFIGFYMVKPEYRGQGYGIQIWNAALARLVGRTIGLDGVVDQQSNYRQSGFRLAHQNVRYQGSSGAQAHLEARAEPDAEMLELSKVPFAELCTYDQGFFSACRQQFLQHWIAQPQAKALAICQNQRLAGYGVIRPCRSGYKLGPLFADSPALAEQLFLTLQAQVPAAEPVFLDIPAVNAAAVDLVQRHQMVVAFETARMYSGGSPDLPLDQIFGITTFELG